MDLYTSTNTERVWFSPTNKMDLKTFLKTEEPKWVQFLAVNAHRVPGVEPSVPFLTDFPRESKDRLKQILLSITDVSIEKANQLYVDIKQKAANLYAQRNVIHQVQKAEIAAGVAFVATNIAYRALGGPPLPPKKMIGLQRIAAYNAMMKTRTR